ncbi:MAG: 6-carboxytetrahydropterin synthase QueD [Deltaproteobacteria bacterium]|nr:6-carboxytetrahydropterin synthase QueD [Deltaproteobacteria bacterium]
MFEVSISKAFSAAHLISNIGGYCEQLHGHNFTVEVTVAGKQLNPEGLLIDFRDLKKRLNDILDTLDHQYLNETEAFRVVSPSAENIAQHIFSLLNQTMTDGNTFVRRVDVWESDNAKASFVADP